MLPVFVLPIRIFSVPNVLENSSSILVILTSSATPEIVDFLLASDIEILDRHINFEFVSFTVPNSENVSVSSSASKALEEAT